MELDLSRTLLLNPLLLVTLEVSIATLVAGFTSSSSLVRLAALPLILTFAWLAMMTSSEYISRVAWANVLGGHLSMWPLQYVEASLLQKWSFLGDGPNSMTVQGRDVKRGIPGQAEGGHGTILSRLRFGLLAVLSHRHTGTPYEVKNVAPFSFKDPSYEPSRATFLKQAATETLICYLILDFTSLGTQSKQQNTILFSHKVVPFLTRLGDVSSEELVIRIMSTIGMYVGIYCFLRGFRSAIGFVAVGTGVGEVRSWRPVFGPLTEAYTIRQFWGIFWHQNQRAKLSGPASFITYDILRLPKGALATRYVNIFLAFWISGVLHACVDIAGGMSLRQSGSIRFFCMQAVAIMLEDGVQAVYRSCRQIEKTNAKPTLATRLIGYGWVAMILVWTTPGWVYPSLRRASGGVEDMIVPFSIVRMFL